MIVIVVCETMDALTSPQSQSASYLAYFVPVGTREKTSQELSGSPLEAASPFHHSIEDHRMWLDNYPNENRLVVTHGALPYCTIPYYTILVLYRTIPDYTILYHTIPDQTVPYHAG